MPGTSPVARASRSRNRASARPRVAVELVDQQDVGAHPLNDLGHRLDLRIALGRSWISSPGALPCQRGVELRDADRPLGPPAVKGGRGPAEQREDRGETARRMARPVRLSRWRARARRRRARLEGGDGVLLLEGEADVVEPVQQAVLAEGIDLEGDRAAVGAGDHLALEIDGQHRVRAARGVVEQLVDLLLRQGDRQDAVLEAVVEEDVGEEGATMQRMPKSSDRPGRVLARRAAAEIVAGHEDLRLAIGGLLRTKSGFSDPSSR